MARSGPIRVVLVVVTFVVLLVAGADAARAQQPDLGIGGTLAASGVPLEGVAVTIADASGSEVNTATTGRDGTWQVDVPAAGTYVVTVDASTLPDGVTLTGEPQRTVTAQSGLVRRVVFSFTGAPDGVEVDDSGTVAAKRPNRIAQAVVNGVKFGLIIAMTAIGLSLIYGTTGLVNFAHGELVTLGAVVAWFLNAQGPQLHLLAAGTAAVAICGVVGALMEKGIWQPIRRRRTGQFQTMVVSIGLALAMRQALLIWFGSSSRRYRNYAIQPANAIGPIQITTRDLLIMGLSILCLVGVALALQRTKVGKATRAVSDNVDLAESTGIDVRRITTFVWAAGAALAALSGVLLGSTTSVTFLSGNNLLLLMFAAVILGGLGTVYGAMVGGLVVGLTTELSTVWANADFKYLWALAVLIVVLLVRPQGILGTKERVG